MSRVVDLQYRLLDRMRHRQAFDVADRTGTAEDFAALEGARQCLVVTFKRSGQGVPTPVNFGLSPDGRLYFRSEPRSAKVRRILNDPRVRACPCNLRGKPTGPTTEGLARIVDAENVDWADAALAGNWTPGMKLMERGMDRLPLELVYVEVKASPPEQGEEQSI